MECLTAAVPCVEVCSPANKLLYHSYHPRASSDVQRPGRQTDTQTHTHTHTDEIHIRMCT